MKTTFVVIPTYNEKENLPALFNKLDKTQEKLGSDNSLNILFVDDNSPDGTAMFIKDEQGKRSFGIHLIERPEKQGLGTAYIDGFKHALSLEADYIIQMDADLSHDPLVIPEMIHLLENHDVVIGSRYIKNAAIPNWSIFRKFISAGGNIYTRIVLGTKIHDYTGGFNAYRKEALENIDLDKIRSNGYSFQIEMKYRAKQKGYDIVETPIHFYDRTHGKSKFSRSIFFEAFINTLKLRIS